MIIGISGSQGRGKSFLIKEMKKRGHHTIDSSTTRSVLKDYNVTLDEANKNLSLKKEIQREVLNRHSSLIEEYSKSNNVILIERTFADIFVYTLLSFGLFNEHDEWINAYYTKCKEAQQYIDQVIYLTGRDYTPENDGVRSTNKFMAKAVDGLIEHYSYDMSGTKCITLTEPSIDGRVELLECIIEHIKQ